MKVNRDNNEVMGGGIEVLGAHKRSMGGLWGSMMNYWGGLRGLPEGYKEQWGSMGDYGGLL